MAVIAPDAPKAAFTAPDSGMVHVHFPIEKSVDTAEVNPVDGTPDIEIWGKATDGTLDSDLQIVDPDWSLKALADWYGTGANVRMQHNPKHPAGVGLEVQGHRVKALIADPLAKHFIRKGVLNDFSVGIMNADIRVHDPAFRHLPDWDKAVNGVITRFAVGEVSVVDRGSNYGTKFTLSKAAADGTPAWVGEMSAPADVMAKVGAPTPVKAAKPGKTVTVDLPKNMRVSIKPSDLAKLSTLRQQLAQEQAGKAAAIHVVHAASRPATVAGDAAGADADLAKAAAAGETGVYKRDIDTATRRRLAGEGRALSDLSYPIENHGDADSAVTLALSGHGNVPAAKKLIRRVARKEGWTDILDRLKGAGKEKAGKAAAPPITKKKGKIKALCPGCGAKQNREHRHCPECGSELPPMAVVVHKNHDFVCLGCGKELDKGEPHCPGCGRENPGYLPEADRKIPANEDAAKVSGKGRVAKGRKNSGKPRGKTPASAGGAVAAPEKPAGPHREPDGAEVEAFEASSHMEDGDVEPPTPMEAHTLAEAPGRAAKATKPAKPAKPAKPRKGKKGKKGKKLPPWLEDKDGAEKDNATDKAAAAGFGDPGFAAALRIDAAGAPLHMGIAHDLTCPAFMPAEVDICYPGSTLKSLDLAGWQEEAMDKAAGANLGDAQFAMALAGAAMTLRGADPSDLADLRDSAHKSFRDANNTLPHLPSPTELSPARYSRPYIAEGHAAPSPQHGAPNHAPVPPAGGIQPEDYRGGYISAGHADQSPANMSTTPPMPSPDHTGILTNGPARGFARDSMREGHEHAMRVLHDHISGRFPSICPMHPHMADTAVPTPAGVPALPPAPGTAGLGTKKAPKAELKAQRAAKAAKVAKRKAAKARDKARAREARIARQVLKGTLTLEDAQVKLGITAPVPDGVKTAAGAPENPVAVPVSQADITAATKAATAPLVKRLKAQGKAMKALRRTANAIAGQPDTTGAPFRGTALPRTPAPAGPNAVTKSAEQQLAESAYGRLYHEWVTTTDPATQEALARQLYPYWNPSMQTQT